MIPLSTFAALPDEGKTVALHVHTHVREDAIQLFGFATSAERATFELLLKASRVGPRLAQNILSGIAADVLVAAIQRGDVSSLRSVPGVGKKTAERIVVELRDRADEVAALTGADSPGTGTGAGGAREVAAQALSALQNLGYPRSQAERVVEAATAEVGGEVSLEVLIREALRRLAR